MKYRFLAEEHEDIGELGWRLETRRDFDPTFWGIGVAHDILEHLPDDTLNLWGELEATGACFFTRGECGYLEQNSIQPVSAILASNLVEVLERYCGLRGGGRDCLLIPDKYRPRMFQEPFMEMWDYADTFLSDTVEKFYQDAEAELENHFGVEDVEALEDAKFNMRHVANCAEVAMRVGYVKARRRYKDMSSSDVAWDLFHPIREQVDRSMKHIDHGMELNVQVILKQRKVACEWYYRRDFY